MLRLVNHCWEPAIGDRVLTPLGRLAVVVSIQDRCELLYVDYPREHVELNSRLLRQAPFYGSALK